MNVTWTYIRCLESAADVFWTPYVRSVYVLSPGECEMWNNRKTDRQKIATNFKKSNILTAVFWYKKKRILT